MSAYDTSTNLTEITAEVVATDRHINGKVGPRDNERSGDVAFGYPDFAVNYSGGFGQLPGWSATVSRSGSGSKAPALARHYAAAELLAADIAEAILANVNAHGVAKTETYEEAVKLTQRMQAVADLTIARHANAGGTK